DAPPHPHPRHRVVFLQHVHPGAGGEYRCHCSVMQPRRQHAIFLLAPALLLLPLPFISAASLFGSTDALFYTLLMKLCGHQLLAGDFWPRWLMNVDSGLGAPLMYYYPPLPYLLTALLTAPLAWLPDGARMLAGMYIATAA